MAGNWVSTRQSLCAHKRTFIFKPFLALSASRGLGLEFVRQIIASPNNVVIATCRNPEKATELRDLQADAKGTLHVFKLDVDDFDGVRDSAQDLSAILGDTGLDYLISNAGVVRR